MFSPRLSTVHNGQSHVCSFTIQLCGLRQASYPQIPFLFSVRSYEGKWFYVKNPGGSASQFTSRVPMSNVEWNYGAEKKFKSKID